MQKYILLLCVIVLFVSCKREEKAGYEAAEVLEMALPNEKSLDKNTDYSSNESSENTEQKIIKNGKLQFETSDLDKTANQIYDAVKKYNAQDRKSTRLNSSHVRISYAVFCLKKKKKKKNKHK